MVWIKPSKITDLLIDLIFKAGTEIFKALRMATPEAVKELASHIREPGFDAQFGT